MNKSKIVELLVLMAIMCAVAGSGCMDVAGLNDQDVIDEYNEYVYTWNKDSTEYQIYSVELSDAIDNANDEIEKYNSKYWDDGSGVEAATDRLRDAKYNYRTYSMPLKGRLEMFRTFLYQNKATLERNDIDVNGDLNDINEWIAEIDYNIQYAGEN